MCNEGLIACPQPDGSITCVQDTIGCGESCLSSFPRAVECCWLMLFREVLYVLPIMLPVLFCFVI